MRRNILYIVKLKNFPRLNFSSQIDSAMISGHASAHFGPWALAYCPPPVDELGRFRNVA